jgi:protein TonB
MTSHEISKANLLDILFENRNKNYGAYELRKQYSNRLGIAVAVMLGFVMLLAYVISNNSERITKAMKEVFKNDVVLTEVDVTPPPIEEPIVQEPAAARPDFRQNNYVNNIEIVSDDIDADMPTHDELTNAAISNVTADGNDFVGDKQPSLGNADKGTGTETKAAEPENSVNIIQKNAEFPGGQAAWLEFLNRYLRTPGELEAGQKRTVLVRFVVGTDGSITNFDVVQSGGTSFDKEVIRVLKKMPRWEPAVQNGHSVSVMFTQPVTFMAVEE